MRLTTMNKAIKGTVHIPAWQQKLIDGGAGGDHVENAQQAYEHVPLIYRAVKLRCDSLTSVPVYTRNKAGDIVNWPFVTPLNDLIWKTEAALLGAGKAIIIKLSNRVRTLDLQWVNPFTVEINYVNNALTFKQGSQVWTAEQVVYIKEFSYADDLTSGVSAIDAAMEDAALLRFQTRFASYFFEHGAMPIILINADGIIDDDEKGRIQSYFTRLASGVGNAFRTLVTRTKLNTNVVSQDIDKMAMPQLYEQAVQNISHAFGLPVNTLKGDDNFASSESHNMQYWEQTVKPRAMMIADAFNNQLLKPMKLELEFAFDEMSLYQEDEEQRAGAYSTYISAGMKPSIAAQMMGLDLPEGITPEMLDPEPEPDKEPEIVQQVEPERTPFQEDMEKYMRKALKRVKDGKSIDCTFESEHIPASMMDEIRAGLKLCRDADEVRAIFEGNDTPDYTRDLLMELKRANELLAIEQVAKVTE